MNEVGLAPFAETQLRALFESAAQVDGEKDVAVIYEVLERAATSS